MQYNKMVSTLSSMTITVPEFLFFHIVSHLYIAYFCNRYSIKYTHWAIYINVIYFVSLCFYYGIKLGWKLGEKFIGKRNKND